jgi:hypothetical protein
MTSLHVTQRQLERLHFTNALLFGSKEARSWIPSNEQGQPSNDNEAKVLQQREYHRLSISKSEVMTKATIDVVETSNTAKTCMDSNLHARDPLDLGKSRNLRLLKMGYDGLLGLI